MENLDFFYQDIGTSSSPGGHLTQKEAAKEALAIIMSCKFALLEEERPIIETMTYHEKYKKILDEIWKDKVELDGNIVKEEEEDVNENALADTGSNINTMPYWIYEQLGREEMKKVGVTTLIVKFLILDIPINRDALIVVGRGFLRMIGGIVNTPERLFLTFNGFCHQTFHGARSDVMRNTESNSDDEEEYQINRNKFGAPIYGPKPALYLNCNDSAERSLREAETNEEIFTSVAWIRAFNINEPIYVKLCHEFYSTYEFDEVCADDELQTKKIIKFRLGGRAHSLTLLEFARRLGMYHADELEEDGFNVYFEGGVTLLLFGAQFEGDSQDDHLWVVSEDGWNGYANVGWLIARWIKRKGAGTQKESQICCGQFILKIARKCRVLTEDVVRSLSDPIYCRDLETTPLRDLIDSEGKLILEDPQPGVPRVGIPRPSGASMQDLYDRMGRM
ncbi:hypothetical protein Tco_1428706 [Tanacetum coccineum]